MTDVYKWHSVEELIDRVADQKVYRDKFLDVMEIIATVTARQVANPWRPNRRPWWKFWK